MKPLSHYIRPIQDFPKPGICFYDMSPMLEQADGLKMALDALEKHNEQWGIDKIVGIDARGFIFGGALADRLKVGFVPVRKKGKLPAKTESISYSLEYGEDTLEIHADAIKEGEKVIIVDDLIATGGTALAACQLVEKIGGQVLGVSAVIALTDLPGVKALADYNPHYLLSYSGD